MTEDKFHITFDLETIGNTSNAPIVQIGAVKFNDNGDILDSFSRDVKLESLSKFNFHVDYSTLSWWFSQEDAAIKRVFCTEERVDIRQALFEFLNWIGKHGDYCYWSHATFDPPILVNNLRAVGLPNPIPFRAYRDIRTLTHFTGKMEINREGIEHNAVDDCVYQAKYISAGLHVIGIMKALQEVKDIEEGKVVPKDFDEEMEKL